MPSPADQHTAPVVTLQQALAVIAPRGGHPGWEAPVPALMPPTSKVKWGLAAARPNLESAWDPFDYNESPPYGKRRRFGRCSHLGKTCKWACGLTGGASSEAPSSSSSSVAARQTDG